jgi:4-hydroxy-3-methylbut-2-en-1-yl diphosphate reductase
VKSLDKLAFVTQTTLSVDDTAKVVETLQRVFPQIRPPRKDDICYATTNRQDAVKQIAPSVDVFIVVGSKASSNANRLREVAERLGAKAYLIDDAQALKAEWVPASARVAVTAGASTPEVLVQGTLARLAEWGHSGVELAGGESESVEFRLPSALIGG